MLIRNLLVWAILVVPACGQTATYNGRSYTPESYPRGADYTYPNCPMCNNIRAQWQEQGWLSGYGSTKRMQPVVAKLPATTSMVSSKTKTKAVESGTETRYRTVTKYRTEAYQVKKCFKGPNGRNQCRLVTEFRQVPYTVQEPYTVQIAAKPAPTPEPKPPVVAIEAKKAESETDISDEPDGTPQVVVDAMLAVMGLDETDTLGDIGCGRDARYLITAVRRYGVRGIGIEINETHAEQARKAVKEAGLQDRISIITVDALDCSYGAFRKVVMYQYPDLQEEILAKLSPGTLVGVYSHQPAAIGVREYRVGDQNFYVGVK